MTDKTGQCECGAVRYTVTGPMRKVVYCHCKQCQRTSGHYVAATACDNGDLRMDGDSGLGWYRSSDFAQRGFCKQCGSSVFWKPDAGGYTSIMAGTLDAPTGLVAREHIFVDDAADFVTIDDGLPQFPGDHDDLWGSDDP